MLRSRITPFLLLNNDHLTKTVGFQDEKYIGDPINAVKIFNEKKADELAIFDYTASEQKREPNFDLLKKIAVEARMPLCYGGGISNLSQAKKLVSFGIEKISISSSAYNVPSLCEDLCLNLGSQSVIVTLDVKKNILGNYSVYLQRGRKKISSNVIDEIKKFNEIGVGELIINNISNDGRQCGYDLNLARLCYETTNSPITILGGANSKEDMKDLIKFTGTIGCGAGSLFVFKGKYRAVLINYPNAKEKNEINGILEQ